MSKINEIYRRPRFDILVILTYYAPHMSGLTEAARLVAEGLAKRGKRVAVLTSQHNELLPREEILNGVHVFRAPVWFTYGRGKVSPAMLFLARQLIREAGVVHLHLPMLEAGLISSLAKKSAIVSTYHIDVWIPPSLTSHFQIAGMMYSARTAIRRSADIVVNSGDQITQSPLKNDIMKRKWCSIPAPCLDRSGGTGRYRQGSGRHYGFLGRIVADKGLEYLIPAFQKIATENDRLLLAGEFKATAGGSNYEMLKTVCKDDSRIVFLGRLDDEQIRDFYASIDVFALTSVVESFGIAQAEAMIAGVPVVGSNLPGGRTPLLDTGFGCLTEPRDIDGIANALIKAYEIPPEVRRKGSQKAKTLYSAEGCVDSYKAIFDRHLELRVV